MLKDPSRDKNAFQATYRKGKERQEPAMRPRIRVLNAAGRGEKIMVTNSKYQALQGEGNQNYQPF